jgi:hypothetical protein
MIGVFAFMGGIYLLVEVVCSMFWNTRAAILIATLAGMMYRSIDMSETVEVEQQFLHEEEVPAEDYPAEVVPGF